MNDRGKRPPRGSSARPGILFADFRGSDSVAFDLVTRKAYAVNPSAKLVIGILQSGRTAADAARAVADEFGIAAAAARADVAEAVRALEAAGLAAAAPRGRAAPPARGATPIGAKHGR